MFRIAWRMLLHDKPKSAGTLFGVFFAVTLISQQLAVLLGLIGLMVKLPRSIDADLWITGEKTETADFGVDIPTQKLYQALGTEGLAWAEPLLMAAGTIKLPDGSTEAVRILGSAAPRFVAGPFQLHEGSRLEDFATPSAIFIDWADRAKFGNPQIGDILELNGKRARVAGFTEGMRPFGVLYVLATLENARDFAGNNGETITYVLAKAAPGVSVETLRENLRARLSDVAIFTGEELASMSRSYWLTRTSIGLNFGIQVGFAVVVGLTVVALTLFSSVVDRLREFGTIKALGARKKDLRRLMLAQALIFAGVGYALGMLAFLGMSAGMAKSGGVAESPPALFLGVALFTLLLCVSSALLAGRRVFKLEPAIVFRN